MMTTFVIAANYEAYLAHLHSRNCFVETPHWVFVSSSFRLAKVDPGTAQVVAIEGWQQHPQAARLYEIIMARRLEPAYSDLPKGGDIT